MGATASDTPWEVGLIKKKKNLFNLVFQCYLVTIRIPEENKNSIIFFNIDILLNLILEKTFYF